MSKSVSKKLKSYEVRSFQNIIWRYYRKHGRKLPWRLPTLKIRKDKTLDPYKVWVSEIMLQQTQVARVLKKYPPFIKRFRNIQTLARASLYEVLSLWSGLGYNRRAKFLHETAKIVVQKYKEVLPRDPLVLRSLPGIGEGTAGSILAFAFNIPSVFIETNIRTVFIHQFFKYKTPTIYSDILENIRIDCGEDKSSRKLKKVLIHDTDILPLIEQTIDTKNPREWYYALMDYGVYLKSTYTNPSRMSAHHTKQSAFEGSHRQVRGEILKILLEHKSVSIHAIKKHIQGDKRHIEDALKELQKENFICIRNKYIERVE